MLNAVKQLYYIKDVEVVIYLIFDVFYPPVIFGIFHISNTKLYVTMEAKGHKPPLWLVDYVRIFSRNPTF